MATNWQRRLRRWLDAGLIDPATHDRILEFEHRTGRTSRFRWPVALALALGALLIGAGVLLFISAHWDALSPAGRMSLAVLLVAVFHVAGTLVADRFEALATALHALGTIALGGGIFLTGQIFNLAENWPAAFLMWAAGAGFGYLLMRDWPQLSLTAILVPWWLSAEWVARHPREAPSVVCSFLLLVAFSYLTALWPERVSDERRALCILGSIAILPLGVLAAGVPLSDRRPPPPADAATWAAWLLALLTPLGVAVLLRGRKAWLNVVAAAWVAVLALAAREHWTLAVHAWCAVGAAGLTAWGLSESRGERVNLGVAGFAITVLFFYFSSVMDKLGRSASLIVLGVLFLAGGWLLEKSRRRLIAQIRGGSV